MKIQIMGYSGSGKSTLAKLLGEYYDLPVLHMDQVQFYGNWQTRSLEEQRQIVQKFLKENEDWVIDGNYTKVVPERFVQCDQLIFLDYSRFFCYWSSFKRYRNNKGKSREDCPCIEKFDFEFQKWILWEGRTKAIRNKYQELLKECPNQTIVFHKRKEVINYLKQLRERKSSL